MPGRTSASLHGTGQDPATQVKESSCCATLARPGQQQGGETAAGLASPRAARDRPGGPAEVRGSQGFATCSLGQPRSALGEGKPWLGRLSHVPLRKGQTRLGQHWEGEATAELAEPCAALLRATWDQPQLSLIKADPAWPKQLAAQPHFFLVVPTRPSPAHPEWHMAKLAQPPLPLTCAHSAWHQGGKAGAEPALATCCLEQASPSQVGTRKEKQRLSCLLLGTGRDRPAEVRESCGFAMCCLGRARLAAGMESCS